MSAMATTQQELVASWPLITRFCCPLASYPRPNCSTSAKPTRLCPTPSLLQPGHKCGRSGYPHGNPAGGNGQYVVHKYVFLLMMALMAMRFTGNVFNMPMSISDPLSTLLLSFAYSRMCSAATFPSSILRPLAAVYAPEAPGFLPTVHYQQ